MESRLVEVNYQGRKYDIALNLREAGEEWILFLHGLGCSKDSFRDVWQREDFRGYSILALDYIGFGDSCKPDYFSYKMEDQATVCAEVLKQFSPKKLHLVAHSMGGAIALLLPDGLMESAESFVNLEGNLSGIDGWVISKRTISLPFADFKRELLPEFMQMSREIGEGRFFLDQASPWAFYKCAESLVSWTESGELLKRFKALPTKKAYIYGQENLEKLALERLESLETLEISASGHFMMNDNPDQFYSELKRLIG